ncbi:3-deoxy-7-phosphoheptulonate synthase [Streptomyces sp. HNM0575]|uniref:3-deoxy-7-phosphoheptulonate synthase n=1 Tax=Streptomyces sp. HNM0575 TaxID=2716338 RepID=UPI00145E2037|nr:3-deoxy-7-phosphoheptulonate synthase [Streptomyces sp. HNM0575]NLU76607.1 3-deoxy-7-phosphoheptulonate synthase [Streptomyces sp. HNM0575]
MQLTGTRPAGRPAATRSPAPPQQPDWDDHPDLERIRGELAAARGLVTAEEVAAARRALASVARGSARALQAGDCAEGFADSGRPRTRAKAAALGGLAGHVSRRVGEDVVLFARMAGQYAKPRSHGTETLDGAELPVYRGDLVNSPAADAASRRHDPHRMLRAYRAGAEVLDALRDHHRDHHGDGDRDGRTGARGERQGEEQGPKERGPWVCHEALVLDYEEPQLRVDPLTGGTYLSSTHFPWVGARTRQPDGAHVRLLASVGNPVGCKIGPSADPQSVVRLCEALDPDREPGRLTLIVRMGRAALPELLPDVVRHVRRAGHPVVWLSDPMHGNTVRTRSGLKTRHLDDMIEEARCFVRVLEGARLHPGGLHLEVADHEVTECVGGPVRDESALAARYESLCDPRLGPEQARQLVDAVL